MKHFDPFLDQCDRLTGRKPVDDLPYSDDYDVKYVALIRELCTSAAFLALIIIAVLFGTAAIPYEDSPHNEAVYRERGQ